MQPKANESQVGGTHYQTEFGRQHWDVVADFGLDYFQGQITRYLFRWRKKNGIEDLKKARHFLDKYIELAEAQQPSETIDLQSVSSTQPPLSSGGRAGIFRKAPVE